MDVILFIYLLGVVVFLLFIVWFNYQFDHDGDLSKVSKKEWIEDIILCPTSWVGVVIGIIVTIWRFKGGKPVLS